MPLTPVATGLGCLEGLEGQLLGIQGMVTTP